MKDTLINLVEILLKKNQISFDKEELAFQIQSHPSYPSLHAITGVLDHFNIENIAAEVPTNDKALQQLPDTFIAQIKTNYGNDLVTASKVKNKPFYSIFSTSKKTEKLSESEFSKQFTGILVAVEKPQDEEKTDLNSSNTKNSILASFLIFLIFSLLINKEITLLEYAYLILSSLGIIASYTILKQELGESTIIGDAFCSGNNERKNCNAVLDSKGAEIIKDHKLSDISIIFFIGLLISFLLTTNFQLLYIISILAMPITAYSIYYQHKVVKSWCVLCLSIVGILWFQGTIAFLNFDFSLTDIKNIKNVIITITCLSGTYLVFSSIKPLLLNAINLKKEKIAFTKFRRNFNLFDGLLQRSQSLNTQLRDSKEIVFGNPNSKLELTIITNPFCGHCKPIHKHLDKILRIYSKNVKIKIRFNIHSADKNSDVVNITSRLLEIYDKKGEKECLQAMNAIYKGEDPINWFKRWGNCLEKESYFPELETEKEWCHENGINFTPEILINGKSYPREYQRTDLIYFIEDLYENSFEDELKETIAMV